jgi:hypothetical protein
MAKKAKREKVIESVELKSPHIILDLERVGLKITPENLTVERYLKVIQIAPTFDRFFTVKYKKHELESKE